MPVFHRGFFQITMFHIAQVVWQGQGGDTFALSLPKCSLDVFKRCTFRRLIWDGKCIELICTNAVHYKPGSTFQHQTRLSFTLVFINVTPFPLFNIKSRLSLIIVDISVTGFPLFNIKTRLYVIQVEINVTAFPLFNINTSLSLFIETHIEASIFSHLFPRVKVKL